MKKKLLALSLSGVMAASMLAGCGGAEEEVVTSTETPSATEETAAQESDAGDAGEAADAGEATEEAAEAGEIDFEEDPVELKVAILSLAAIPEEITDHVEEYLNKISLEKINATVDYTWYDGGNYGEKVSMAISGGEQLDLIMYTPIPNASFQSYMNQSQLEDISDSLDTYGQGILKYMRADGKDFLGATSRDGGVYGVGVLQDMSQSMSFDLRADVLEDLGLTDKAKNATSFTDIEEITKEVVANSDLKGFVNMDSNGTVLTPQPYVPGDGSFADAEWLDTVGDGSYYVYADPADDKIKCFFEHPKWQAGVKMARKWYEEGLIWKDSATSKDTYGTPLIKNDVAFGIIHGVEMGNAALVESQTGYPDFQIDVTDCKVNTGAFTKFGMAVPVTTVDKDRAVALLNLIWDDEDYRNGIAWGEEGVDWVRNDDGTARYADGKDESNAYHTADFLYGNRLETIPWEGEGQDTLRERQKAANESLEVSKYFGFSIDQTNVADSVTAVKNVFDKYYPQLCTGTAEDVDATLASFVDELYGAGMQTMIDEYQSQLDAWLATQN